MASSRTPIFRTFCWGLPAQSDLDNISQDNDGRSSQWALFGQDSFRFNPRLTFEYGLRWEYHPGYIDAGSNIGNFDQAPLRSGSVVYPDGGHKGRPTPN